MSRRMFTLLEMLVVLSIISILLSLSVASGTSSDVAAQRVECLNNKKQVITAQLTYSLSNDGQIIYSVDGTAPYSMSLLGYEATQKDVTDIDKKEYETNLKIMPQRTPILVLKSIVCPAFKTSDEEKNILLKVDGMLNVAEDDYFFKSPSRIKDPNTNKGNYFGRFLIGENKKTQTYQIGKIQYPSELMIFADCFSSKSQYWYFRTDKTVSTIDGHSAGVSPRHNGNCTVSYVDGHAACVDMDELIDGTMQFDRNAIVPLTDEN